MKDVIIKKIREQVLLHKDDLVVPKEYLLTNNKGMCKKLSKIDQNTWFSLEKSDLFKNDFKLENPKGLLKDKILCRKIKLKLAKDQKFKLDIWFKACTQMYNESIVYIKKTKCTAKRKVRTELKEIRDDIKRNSGVMLGKREIKIYTHTLDSMIGLACTNYKSAFTNLRNKNITHFRIRRWKFNTNKIIKLEHQCLNKPKATFYKLFGNLKTYYDGKEYDLTTIDKECVLKYNVQSNEYYLFIPVDKIAERSENRSNLICIDPGLRTFLSGVSNNHILEIGNNIQSKIKRKYLDIDELKKRKINGKKKKKILLRLRRKLKNLKDELHWKSINYLVKNYDNILIGDLNSKGTVKRGGVLQPMSKRMMYFYSFFQFKTRLKDKCEQYGCTLNIIDEVYTSKMCSSCGNIKTDLGGNKTYNCTNCNLSIDRDRNSCKCIYAKNFLKK